jgi:hypothetical protein
MFSLRSASRRALAAARHAEAVQHERQRGMMMMAQSKKAKEEKKAAAGTKAKPKQASKCVHAVEDI